MGERLAAHGLALPPGHTLVSIAERPEIEEAHHDLNAAAWPRFMLQDPVAHACWDHLFADFAEFQGCLFDGGGGLVAGFNSAPLAWDGTEAGLPDGWDDQLRRTVADLGVGIAPDTLGALQVVVRGDRRGAGYSGVMVGAMRALAAANGFRALIACVRPTEKIRYPLTPIESYATWVRDGDGLPLDPWIRLHVRLGGRVVRPAPASMRIEGTVAEWRSWTGLAMPESGAYLPAGAAAPVTVDVEADRGVYLDPNVWVVHRIG